MKIVEGMKSEDITAEIQRGLLECVKDEYKDTFRLICTHIDFVSFFEGKSKMTLENLMAAWIPALLGKQKEGSSGDLEKMTHITPVMTKILRDGTFI